MNTVGDGTPGAATAKTYGVSISKAAYSYNAAASSLGVKLTSSNPVNAGDLVCYEMTITNFKDADIEILQLIDKLPADLSLQSVSFYGVTSSAVLRRGNTYTALSVSGEASTNHQTTEAFRIASGETVRVYLIANVSQAAIDASINTSQRITNSAYVKFNSVETGDARVNIYTNADTERKLATNKWFKFVADFDDDLHYNGTWLQTPAGADVPCGTEASTATVWNGAYIGYQVQIKNATASAKNIDVYEIIDSLPPGTEFVGVAKNGDRAEFNNLVGNKRDLTGELIFNGETAAWTGGVHSSLIKCTYDQTSNQVRIQFVDSENASAPISVIPSDKNAQKLFMLIVARVKDDSAFTSYANTIETKVDKDVAVNDPTKNGLRTEGEYNYVSASCTANTVAMQPGITKQYVGHYFPSGTAVPASVSTSANISPGESLRFTIQAKNQGLDNNNNAANANLQDFTVTDILPAEYTYRANSAKAELNAGYNTATGLYTTAGTSDIARGSFEPTQRQLPDGRTELTWTFSGKDLRLMSNSLRSGAGFMHIITYDTDWNTKYLARYGNYTNSANVNHSYKFTSVSTGAPDYEEKSIAASAVVNVFGAAGTSAVKSVTNAAGGTASGGDTIPYVSISGAGAEVRYTLNVTNSTAAAQNSQMKSLVIIDELPRAAGDTGVVNRTGRGSQFSVKLGAVPNVVVTKLSGGAETPVASSEYTVSYGDSVGGLNSNGDWSDSATGGRIAWGTASNGKNAVRIAFDPEYSFAAGETIRVSFSAFADGDADAGETAWNSFGYSYKALAAGKISEKIFAEPPRVGISVPGASISVTKAVTGDTAPVATLFTFLLKQNGAALADVKYTLSGDDAVYRTGLDGSFTLNAAQTATLSVAPGSGYTIEETALPADFTLTDITAATAGDGTYAAPLFTFKTLADTNSVGAVCTNNYTTPPTRDLTVSKVWAGATNPNQPSSVSVQLYGNGIAAGSPVTLSAGNFWSYTWTALDTTATTWTVEELGSMPGYTKLITGNDIDGYIVTNTYKEPNITLTARKVWDGDADPNQPASVNVQLYGNNIAVRAEKTLDASNNWQCSWADLDPAVTWTVRETTALPSEYSTGISRIGNDFIITNTYTAPQPQRISVRAEKQWRGDADPNQPASIQVRLNMDGAEYDIKSLSAVTNWSYTWHNLEQNHTWTVEEITPLPTGYTSAVGGNATDGFVITNTYAASLGKLTLSKQVSGSGGDKTKDWTFVVTFSDNGTYSYSGSKTGTLRSGGIITLKHGQRVTFADIPYGTSYTVAEREANADGYTTTVTGASGTIGGKASHAAFINSKGDSPSPSPSPSPTPDPTPDPSPDPSPDSNETSNTASAPDTGDNFSFGLWAMLLVISLVSLSLLLHRIKRRI